MTEPKSDKNPHLHVETPCPKKWAELTGTATGDLSKRYCSQCELHVHNSEELTQREAEKLVRESDERVCMRIVADAAGKPKFKAEPAVAQADVWSPGVHPTVTPGFVPDEIPQRHPMRAVGLALAAGGLIAACQPTKDRPDPNYQPTPIETNTGQGGTTPPAHPSDSPTDLEIMGDVIVMGIAAPGFPADHPPEDTIPADQTPVDAIPVGPTPSTDGGPEIMGKIAPSDPEPVEMLGEVIAPEVPTEVPTEDSAEGKDSTQPTGEGSLLHEELLKAQDQGHVLMGRVRHIPETPKLSKDLLEKAQAEADLEQPE